MTERLRTHVFEPQKANKNVCNECPYMASNPIHRRHGAETRGDFQETFVRGTATPNKLG